MTFEVAEDELLPRKVWGWLVKKRSEFRCEECEVELDETHLHAHHVDRDPTNNRLDNGRALCPGCHVREHAPGITPRTRPVDEASMESRNSGVRPHQVMNPLPHIREKIAKGKYLRPREYRVALRAMIYVPPDLRP